MHHYGKCSPDEAKRVCKVTLVEIVLIVAKLLPTVAATLGEQIRRLVSGLLLLKHTIVHWLYTSLS